MQEQDYSFERLRAELLEKLRDQGYSPITITGYRYQFNSVSNGWEETATVITVWKEETGIYRIIVPNMVKTNIMPP